MRDTTVRERGALPQGGETPAGRGWQRPPGRPPARLQVRADLRRTSASMGQRYGAVLLLMLTLVVFSILSANGAWTRALAFAVECGALLVLIETSRESPKVRRLRAGFGALALVLVSLVLTDVLSPAVVFSFQFAVGIVLVFLLVRGLVRIVKTHGVTLQVVAGALGVYLLLGMLFRLLLPPFGGGRRRG